ncbi:MAG: WYL domain-containing protein [Leptospirales bacterium]|nr:WYL domain-containing protein [Leptospirales bacterium]
MPVAYEGQPESARRKFERDKDELKALGLPLQHYAPDSRLPDGRTARDHVYAISEEAEPMPVIQLSAEQAQILAMLLLGAAADSPPAGDHERALLRSAAAKLLYLNPHALKEYEDAAPAKNSRARPVDSPELTAALETLAAVHDAIHRQRVLEFNYRARDGRSQHRRVAGRGLIAHQRRWCLAAYCYDRRAIRLFYLDRMDTVRISETRYEKDPSFNIRNYSLHPLAVHVHDPQQIAIKLDSQRADEAMEFLTAANGTLEIRQTSETQLNLTLTNREALFDWMLKKPGIVVALGPAQAREQFEEYRQAVIQLYKASAP